MKGFSLEAYRNANKFELYSETVPQDIKRTEGGLNITIKAPKQLNGVPPTESLIFSGYYIGGNKINIQLNTGDYVKGLEETLQGMSPGAALAIDAIAAAFKAPELSSAIDFNYSPFIRGVKPIEFHYDVVLIVKDSFENDIKTPLHNLLSFCVPSYSEKVGISTDGNAAQMAKKVSNFLGTGWEGAQRAFDTLVSAFKGVRMLNEPPQIKNTNKTIIKVGSFTWSDVIVSNITIDLGPNVYAGDNECYPAYAKVGLDIQGMTKPVWDNLTMFR